MKVILTKYSFSPALTITTGNDLFTCSWILFYGKKCITGEPPHDKTNKMTCVSSEDSDAGAQADLSLC